MFIRALRYARGCRTNSVIGDAICEEGALTGIQYKDCITTCETDGCNNDNSVDDLITNRDEDGNPVQISCYSCSSSRDDDGGIIDGRPECFTTPVSDGTKRDCPIFANHGCFKVSSNYKAL